jgi:hypothetical protein
MADGSVSKFVTKDDGNVMLAWNYALVASNAGKSCHGSILHSTASEYVYN